MSNVSRCVDSAGTRAVRGTREESDLVESGPVVRLSREARVDFVD